MQRFRAGVDASGRSSRGITSSRAARETCIARIRERRIRPRAMAATSAACSPSTSSTPICSRRESRMRGCATATRRRAWRPAPGARRRMWSTRSPSRRRSTSSRRKAEAQSGRPAAGDSWRGRATCRRAPDDAEPYDPERMRRVLLEAVERGGFGKPAPEGRARGLASITPSAPTARTLSRSRSRPAATARSASTIHKVVSVGDCRPAGQPVDARSADAGRHHRRPRRGVFWRGADRQRAGRRHATSATTG